MAVSTGVLRAGAAGPQLICISASQDGNVCGLDRDGNLLDYALSPQPWTNLPGSLSCLSVCSDGTAWGLTGDGGFCQYQGSGWQPLGSPTGVRLVLISAGSANDVWGLDGAGQAYRYAALTAQWS